MKKNISLVILIFFSLVACDTVQTNDPWTKNELMAPEKLADMISNKDNNLPVIFDIGPSGVIKGAILSGEAKDKENLQRLKSLCEKMPKDKPVVIYCGCCPFADCPNVRPAFKLLKELKFTSFYLLNIPENLKANWIDKGYPMEAQK